jgi:hypothetical protein
VARSARFEQRLAERFPVSVEMSESPAAGSGVLFRVLDLYLNVCVRAGDKGLLAPKDLVVLIRRNVLVVQSDDDCAVGKGRAPATTATAMARLLLGFMAAPLGVFWSCGAVAILRRPPAQATA